MEKQCSRGSLHQPVGTPVAQTSIKKLRHRRAATKSEPLTLEQLEKENERKKKRAQAEKRRQAVKKKSGPLTLEQLEKENERKKKRAQAEKRRQAVKKQSGSLTLEQLEKENERKKKRAQAERRRQAVKKQSGSLTLEQLEKENERKTKRTLAARRRQAAKKENSALSSEQLQKEEKRKKIQAEKSRLRRATKRNNTTSTSQTSTKKQRMSKVNQPVGFSWENGPESPTTETRCSTPTRGNQTKTVPRQLESELNTTLVAPNFKRRGHRPWSNLLRTYFNKISRGPTWICSCCGGLFYREGVKMVDKLQLRMWGLKNDQIASILCVDHISCQTWKAKTTDICLCITCHNTAKTKRIPRLALSNGLDYPEIPPELKELTQLEERMVAPRLPFMQIRLTGFEQQWSIHGNVVNVESNIDTCVSSLPREYSSMTVVQLKLMRRMNYTKPYLYDKIRPAVVMRALKYLINTPLYLEDNVTLSPNWGADHQADEMPFQNEQAEEHTGDDQELPTCHENEEVVEIDQIEEESGLADDHTLLYNEDIANVGLKIAPAEGNIPIPFHRDPMAEQLSFPTIYCGQKRILNSKAKLSYTDIVKSELRRYDRRSARPEKILFSFHKSYSEKVRDALSICVRQKPTEYQGESVTAGMIKQPGYLSNLICKDDGYAVYKQVRCTPPYWKEQLKKVTSMVRQLGTCTFFITLSAAETRWPELLTLLYGILNNQPVGENEVMELPFAERAKLVRTDPVTCMRHFDHKYRALLNTLLKPEDGVFEPHEIEDWFSRVEFQMRGSPHSHGLYWLKDAPHYNLEQAESEELCVNFIDKYITCERDHTGEMANVMPYQIHRHTHTCKKKIGSAGKCRFKYPKPPMLNTRILVPLPKDIDEDERKQLREIYTKIEAQLNAWGRNFEQDTSLAEMLQLVGISHDDYINAIRSTISRPTIFLKRLPKESFVNAYNRKILLAWKANMDIQFVLDGYACAKYVAAYISKSGGGVSKLLRTAAAEVNDGNTNIASKLQRFASILIKGSEISAQEAAAFCLGLGLTSFSRGAVFVNTGRSNQRVRMLKPQKDIDDLDDHSQEIYMKNAIERYAKRPESMESLCLAEFVTSWTHSKQKKHTNEEDEAEMNEQEEFEAPQREDIYVKRDKPKILRFRNYSRVTEEDEYWREQLMLFLPWRNELREIEECADYFTLAKLHETEILENSRVYYNQRETITCLEGLENEIDYDALDPSDNLVEEQSEVVDNPLEQEENRNYVNEFLSSKATAAIQKFLAPKLIEKKDYLKIMRSLNIKQRQIVLEILRLLKTNQLPFYIFLSGGAGVGKSHVITAIVQSFLRYCNKLPNLSPESMPIVVCAPTGKAAFNVFGMTIHNVFRIPPTQFPGPIPLLEEGFANSLRLKFRNTQLFIIDEISMVGAIQLDHIDKRLRQLFDQHSKFGGKSILVVGHLRQLPPVGMSSIFKSPELRGSESIRTSLIVRNPLWEHFRLFELDEIMRQRNAHAFCKALNNMAEGTMDEEDIQLIQSRVVTKDKAPKDAVWLFSTNAACEKHNNETHAEMGTESAISVAVDKVTGDGTQHEQLLFKEVAKDFDKKESTGLLYKVNLQVGGIYFVTTNINVSDGLFNGATGILRAIEYGVKAGFQNETIPTSAWVEFCHASIGQELRSNIWVKQRAERLGFPTSWTPIDRLSIVLNKKLHGMKVTRKQIPVQAANGMTIHKSQGSSLDKVVACVGKRISRELLYVACSRATSLEGLFIVGEFKPPTFPGQSDPITKEMNELAKAPHKFLLRFPDIEDTSRIYFHNVEGFLSHQADILSDPFVTSHSHLIFVEPQITSSNSIDLNGYKTVFRQSSRQTKNVCNSEGVLLLTKEFVEAPENLALTTETELNYHCLILAGVLEDVHFFAVYKHPKYSSTSFLQLLSRQLAKHHQKNVLVFGDMNMDLTDPANKKVLEYFKKYNLFSSLSTTESTTDYNTHLDVCFTNMTNVRCYTYENYYSYHKPLFIEW